MCVGHDFKLFSFKLHEFYNKYLHLYDCIESQGHKSRSNSVVWVRDLGLGLGLGLSND